jgi:hypothetical protein
MLKYDLSDPFQGFPIRLPDTAADKGISRFKVDIITRGMHISGPLMAKMHPCPGLIGPLIFAETHIPIDAEQRSANYSGHSHIVGADLWKPLGESSNKNQQRFFQIFLITSLILLKPGPVIILLQLRKKHE